MKLIKINIVIVLTALLTGVASGWIYGSYIIKDFLNGKIGISAFIFLPSKNMIDTMVMLNSENELKRIEGYYAYRESGLRDPDFLYQRYKQENSDITRKTIIWIAQDISDEEKLHDFYKKLYQISPDNLKRYLQMKINSFDLIEAH